MDADEFVGLEAEVPLGVAEGVLDGGLEDGGVALGIACVAGLQAPYLGVEHLFDGLHVLSLEDGLQFVGLEDDSLRQHLGRAGYPVDGVWQQVCAVGFYLYVEAYFVQGIDQLRQVVLQRGFAACNDGVAGFVRGCGYDDFLHRHFPAFLVTGVAEDAMQVAAAGADEHGGCACVASLALYGAKYLVNLHRARTMLRCSGSPPRPRDRPAESGRKSSVRCSRLWG